MGALLILLISILGARRTLAYDEVFHLTTVKALFRLGFSRAFLMGTPWSATGPLYALVQGAFAMLTNLRPPGIRLVNFLCVLGTLAMLWRTLQLRNVSAPANVMLGVLAAPMGWIIFGLALTEAPAILCVAGSFLLTVIWMRQDNRPLRRDLLAVGAGLLLGTAVCGRQVYLVLLPAIALLVKPGTLRPAFLQLLAASFFPAALFMVWGGLAPLEMRFADHGLRPSSALLSYAYTGFTALLLAPRFFSLSRRTMVSIAVFLLVSNLVFGIYEHLTMGFLVKKYLPEFLLPLVARTCGSVLLILAALFIVSSLKNLWERRGDGIFIFACAGTLALALTPIKITHVWDIRYVSIVLPTLIITLDGWVIHNFARVFRLAIGVSIAAVCLQYALKVSWDEENPPTMHQIFSALQAEGK